MFLLFHWGEPNYYTDYPVLDQAVIQLLIDRQVKMVGVDTPSPDKYPYPGHSRFFEAEICILENLTGLEALCNRTSIEIFAFPLKLIADSSPVRVVARVV